MWRATYRPMQPSLRLVHSTFDDSANAHQRSSICISYMIDDSIAVPSPQISYHSVLAQFIPDSMKQLGAPPGHYNGIYWMQSQILATIIPTNENDPPTSVLAPYYDDSFWPNYGAVVAWTDVNRIGIEAFNMQNPGAWIPSPIIYCSYPQCASNNDTNAEFPTIIETADTTTASSLQYGLAFRQWWQIIFAKITLSCNMINTNLSCAGLTRLSLLTGSDCTNDHPCIDVCNIDYKTNPANPYYSPSCYVTWDAFERVDTLNFTPQNTRYIWSAMNSTWGGWNNPLWAGWNYIVFGISAATMAMNHLASLPVYEFPSNRVYDGYYQPGEPNYVVYGYQSQNLSWYDSLSENKFFAYDSNDVYYQPIWKLYRFNPAAIKPNIGISAHDLPSYLNQYAVIEPVSPASIATDFVQNIGDTTTVKIISKVLISLAPLDSLNCLQDRTIWSAEIYTPPGGGGSGSINPYQSLPIRPLTLPNDSAIAAHDSILAHQWVAKPIIAPLKIQTHGSSITFTGYNYTTEASSLASWLGVHGNITSYLSVMNAINDSLIGTIDSIVILSDSVQPRFDSLFVPLDEYYR